MSHRPSPLQDHNHIQSIYLSRSLLTFFYNYKLPLQLPVSQKKLTMQQILNRDIRSDRQDRRDDAKGRGQEPVLDEEVQEVLRVTCDRGEDRQPGTGLGAILSLIYPKDLGK